MKTLILACFLFAGIAGTYAQTNNNTGTAPSTSPTITPNDNGAPANPDNRGTANDGVVKNKPQNTDTTTYKNPITNPQYKTDPRNEYETPNGPNPTGKTTTPNTKKSAKPGATPPAGN